jgi:acyl dehydratase
VETLVIEGPDGLQQLTGKAVGPTDWRVVTQEMIDAFADLSGDHQWIHVDVERAKTESPFGTTIAHGNLTLSMVDGFRLDLIEVRSGFALGVNYGWNKVRFPSPVPAGSKVRATAELTEANDLGNGWIELITKFTLEVQGADGTVGEKPCFVGESVTRALKAQA